MQLFQKIQHAYVYYFSKKVPVNKLTFEVMVVSVQIRTDLFHGIVNLRVKYTHQQTLHVFPQKAY